MPDFVSAIEEALSLAIEAVMSGAKFLALPEYCGGLLTKGGAFAPPHAPEDSHPFLAAMREFSAKNGIWMLVGSNAISCSGGKYYNRSFMIDSSGSIVSRYDKVHLFDVTLSEDEIYRESDLVVAGQRAVLVKTPFGIVAHSICYDIRFPRFYREMCQAGAEIIVIPAAFTKTTGEAHWHLLNRARAVENGAFVVAPCAIGPVSGGGEAYGHSLIVSPWGDVLIDGGKTPCVAQAQIEKSAVNSARSRIASLEHDRNYKLVPALEERKISA
jgi:predicted amidohydrolase